MHSNISRAVKVCLSRRLERPIEAIATVPNIRMDRSCFDSGDRPIRDLANPLIPAIGEDEPALCR